MAKEQENNPPGHESKSLSDIQLVVVFFMILLILIGLLVAFVVWSYTLPPQVLDRVYFIIIVILGLLSAIITVGILKGTAAVGGSLDKIKFLNLDKIEASGAVAVLIIVVLLAIIFKPGKANVMSMTVRLRDTFNHPVRDLDGNQLTKVYFNLKGESNSPADIEDGQARFEVINGDWSKQPMSLELDVPHPCWEVVPEKWKVSDTATLHLRRPEACRTLKFEITDLEGNPIEGKIIEVEGKQTLPSDKNGHIDYYIKEEIDSKTSYSFNVLGDKKPFEIKPCNFPGEYHSVHLKTS